MNEARNNQDRAKISTLTLIKIAYKSNLQLTSQTVWHVHEDYDTFLVSGWKINRLST